VQLALHRQPLLAAQSGRRLERAFGGGLGARVVAECRPGRGQSHLDQRARRLARGRAFEEIARGHGVERAQPLQPFGVQLRRLDGLGDRGTNGPRDVGGVLVDAQALPEGLPRRRDEREEVRLGAGLRHRDRLARAAEPLDVEAQLTGGGRRPGREGPDDHDIGRERLAHAV
jgi:hypothetical protein